MENARIGPRRDGVTAHAKELRSGGRCLHVDDLLETLERERRRRRDDALAGLEIPGRPVEEGVADDDAERIDARGMGRTPCPHRVAYERVSADRLCRVTRVDADHGECHGCRDDRIKDAGFPDPRLGWQCHRPHADHPRPTRAARKGFPDRVAEGGSVRFRRHDASSFFIFVIHGR